MKEGRKEERKLVDKNGGVKVLVGKQEANGSACGKDAKARQDRSDLTRDQ